MSHLTIHSTYKRSTYAHTPINLLSTGLAKVLIPAVFKFMDWNAERARNGGARGN